MERYEIRIAGHLDRRRARSLGCEDLRLLADEDSVLVFAAVDQAALYGLLTRLRDTGLRLLAVNHVPVSSPGRDDGAHPPSKEAPHVAD
jgi:hypothetical protein